MKRFNGHRKTIKRGKQNKSNKINPTAKGYGLWIVYPSLLTDKYKQQNKIRRGKRKVKKTGNKK